MDKMYLHIGNNKIIRYRNFRRGYRYGIEDNARISFGKREKRTSHNGDR